MTNQSQAQLEELQKEYDVTHQYNEKPVPPPWEQGWISVEERLPNNFEEVLLVVSGRNVVCGFTPDKGQSFYTYALIDFETERVELDPIGPRRVSLWQPLPEPPR